MKRIAEDCWRSWLRINHKLFKRNTYPLERLFEDFLVRDVERDRLLDWEWECEEPELDSTVDEEEEDEELLELEFDDEELDDVDLLRLEKKTVQKLGTNFQRKSLMLEEGNL
ncbi:hypothetical protein J437_LFUL014264 [Ladona fulva]|uniref:Uncharacterized protein n=1 Tax=Ladona fulva TaxID=123851 RepID=A0A8K0P967_LADFU|nr:hypothetical protein J437_LFUL014264 [Ladona fulva]